MIIGFTVAALTITILIAVLGGTIYLISRRRAGDTFRAERIFFRGYLFIATAVSLVVVLFGMATLVRAALSEMVGKDFSYYVYSVATPRPAPAEPGGSPVPAKPPPGGEDETKRRDHQIDREFKNNIIDGATMAIVGGLVFLSHGFMRKRVERSTDDIPSDQVQRAYVFVMLVTLGIASLVSLSSGIAELLRFYILDPVSEFDTKNPPGDNIGFAIAFFPAWLYFIIRAIKEYSITRKTDTG